MNTNTIVDVVAVLNAQIKHTRQFGGSPSVETLEETRDAMEAMINDMKEIHRASTLGILYHSIGPGYTEEIKVISQNAIIRSGGAA